MRRPFLNVFLTFLVLTLFLGLIKFIQIKLAIANHGNFQPPPESIEVAPAIKENWPQQISTIGFLSAINGAMLTTENSGVVSKINSPSGALVKEGEVLIELNTSSEKADLARASARLDWAIKNYNRAKNLKANNAASQQALEDADYELRAAKAQEDSLKSIIEKKRIVAPYSGILGVIRVNLGQYIKAGDEIVYLLNPTKLKLNFQIPQRFIELAQIGNEISFTVDSYPEKVFQAKVAAIDSSLESATRGINLQAQVENAFDENNHPLLLPQMYAKILLRSQAPRQLLTLPISAVKASPFGDFVYKIEKTLDANGTERLISKEKTVTLGERRQGKVAIIQGVEEGEIFAISGVFKLRADANVTISNQEQKHSS
ncbi:MAG TPA: efflux RND transporter periplasmic adaptor subunit [Oligoflexia bacterium]|nr:efflux RND transporter periplasmic adaptor subunit [Oligoflexia bacterium]HMP27922.1 efflux RND transporter periplasmic adaptor subunit [Oligoflexia bacterium]